MIPASEPVDTTAFNSLSAGNGKIAQAHRAMKKQTMRTAQRHTDNALMGGMAPAHPITDATGTNNNDPPTGIPVAVIVP